MLTSLHLLFALLIACTATVFTCVLTEPGEIFSWWKSFWYKKLNVNHYESNGLPYPPLYKVLVHCEKCISGQMAFWTFIIYNYDIYQLRAVIPHLLFTGLTIFLSLITKKIYNWTIN